MSQLNIHMTPTFEKELRTLMRVRHIKTKSEAIRIAVKESLEHTENRGTPVNFLLWVGRGKQVPENKAHRFKSDDDLWK